MVERPKGRTGRGNTNIVLNMTNPNIDRGKEKYLQREMECKKVTMTCKFEREGKVLLWKKVI